jgi:hypothetical protein
MMSAERWVRPGTSWYVGQIHWQMHLPSLGDLVYRDFEVAFLSIE